jgi:hypothetical protein
MSINYGKIRGRHLLPHIEKLELCEYGQRFLQDNKNRGIKWLWKNTPLDELLDLISILDSRGYLNTILTDTLTMDSIVWLVNRSYGSCIARPLLNCWFTPEEVVDAILKVPL